MENFVVGEDPLELRRLCKVIGNSVSYPNLLKSWKRFGRKLGVSEITILDLEKKLLRETTQPHDILYELLSSWRAEKASRATLKILLAELGNCQISDIEELVEQEFWLVVTKLLKIKLNDRIIKLGELSEITSTETYKYIYDAFRKTHCVQPIELLKQHIVHYPNKSDFYIPRTLSITTQIDEKIFTANLSDHVFLVKGISKHQLARLTGHTNIDVSRHQLDEITVGFMVLEGDGDFERICQKTDKPVHFIRRENRSFFWVKSNKELDKIQQYFKEEKETYSEEELITKYTEIAHSPLRAVSISDSPGMGKTFLLANMASQLKVANNAVVISIILQEFVKETKIEISSESSALDAILDYASPNELAKRILKVILETNKINLFLDAYDEVTQDKLKEINVFLSHVVNISNFRVFVTTRPHMRKKLEDTLNLLSYKILPFNESNQIEFLTKYWANQHNIVKNQTLQKYAKNCLKVLQYQMTDTEVNIAGIPLQCRLLADVYADDAKRASKLLSADSSETIRIKSLFDVYKKLIDVKFQRVPESSGLSVISWFRENTKRNYLNAHIYDSLMLLFPSMANKFEPRLKGFRKIDRNTLYSIGLIEESPNITTPRFVHRTFAEYLLAEFLVKNLSSFDECVQLVFGYILGRDGVQPIKSALDGPELYVMDNVTIGYFLDMHLKDQMKQCPLNELAINLLQYRNKIDFTNVCKSMAACGPQDFETTFELLREIFLCLRQDHDNPTYLQHMRDTYFKYLPHLIIQNTRNLALVKKAMGFIKLHFNVDFNYHVFNTPKETYYLPWIPGCTPLHVAVYYGKYNIVTDLLEQYDDITEHFKYILHLCARYSANETEAVIQYKLSITDLLAAKAKESITQLLNESLDDRTPLLEKDVHLKLLQQYHELGSDITSFSKYGTVLHSSGIGQNYNDLLRWVMSSGFTLINHTDLESRTPLLHALGRKEVKLDDSTLEVFHKAGADYKACDKDGDSVLLHALRAGRSEVVIKKLIDCGANVNHQNSKSQNAGHVLLGQASISNPYEVLDRLNLLVSLGFNKLNQPDSEGLTAFDLVLQNVEHFDHPKLFEFFNLNGVDFNAEFNFNINFLTDTSNWKRAFASQYKYSSNFREEVPKPNTHFGPKQLMQDFVLSRAFCRPGKTNNYKDLVCLASSYGLNFMGVSENEMLDFLQEAEPTSPFRNFNDPKFQDDGSSELFGFVEYGNFNWPVLFHAIGRTSLASVEKILECGANVNYADYCNFNAAHPIFLNADSSNTKSEKIVEVLRLLISKGFDKIDEANIAGSTPLIFAMNLSSSVDLTLLVDFFQEKGANFNAVNKNGLSALPCAVGCNQNAALLKKLIEYGADLYHLNSDNHNALHIAAHCRNVSALEFLLDKFDIESKTKYGRTPLHQLMIAKVPLDAKLLDLFQEKGANFNAVDNEGWSVLHAAICGNQNATIISKLVEYGADLYHLNSNKATALHVAAYNRNVSALELLKNMFDIETRDEFGRTPLHELFRNLEPIEAKLLDLFREKGADFNAEDDDGWSALLLAVGCNQNATVISKLIEYGADLYHHNSGHVNALHVAAYCRNASALEFLINKIDIESKDEFGLTALHQLVSNTEPLDKKLLDLFQTKRANFNSVDDEGWSVLLSAIACNQNATILGKLLDTGADLYHLSSNEANALHFAACNRNVSALEFLMTKLDIESKDTFGRTPLHQLVINPKPLDVKLLDLFRDKEANFNATDYNGESVLFFAIEYNKSVAVISKLLEYGADLYHLNSDNQNALHLAAYKRNVSTLEYLINKFDIESKDKFGHTSLHLLVSNTEPLEEELLDLYIEKGANCNAIDNEGWSVLLTAVECNQGTAIIGKLLDNGADLYHVNSNNETALHLAASNRSLSALEFLINKFEIEPRDKFGRTPLHHFLLKTEPLEETFLDLFLANGANFSAVDNDGWSVLFLAIQGNQNASVISKLLEYGADLHHLTSEKMNALHVAAFERNRSVLELLTEKLGIDSVDNHGQTPLLYLVCNEQPLDPNLLDLFHERGADFNAANQNESILLAAIKGNQNATIISKIIEYGGDPFHTNSHCSNALLIATQYANFSALEFLLGTFNYDINAADDDGDTPLHTIFTEEHRCYRNVLELLLKHNPKFEIKNKNGFTPIVSWIIQGDNPIPTLLELQDQLPISIEIASNALTVLVCQENLLDYMVNASEQEMEAFRELFNLLICKGGRIVGNDGSQVNWNSVLHRSYASLDQAVVINDQLKQHIFENLDAANLSQESIVLFSDLIKQANVSMEDFLDGLLLTKQYDLFQTLCLELKAQAELCSDTSFD